VERMDLGDLVVLLALAEKCERIRDGEVLVLEREILADDLSHALFDLRQVLFRERPREVEVVVEAVRNRRPETEFGLREELEHGASHHMRGRMPQRVELFAAVVSPSLRPCHGLSPDKQNRLRHWDEGDLAVPPSFAGRADDGPFMKSLAKRILPAPAWNRLRRTKSAAVGGFQSALERAGYVVAERDDYYSPLPPVSRLRATRERWNRPSAMRGVSFD